MTQNRVEPLDNRIGLDRLFGARPHLTAGLGALVIAVATLLAYLPAMGGGFVWDDDYYVSANEQLRSWVGLQRIWMDVLPDPVDYPLPQYYPMTHTSFWLEYRFYGDNPIGYHIDNVILHILDALLIWLILSRLDVPGAWLAAAIFALHPINVESVAWIAERKNVLSLLFFLSSIYVYLRYAGIIRGNPRKPGVVAEGSASEQPIDWASLPDDPMRLYGLAAVLFLCAIFSKTVTYSMPAVVLLIIGWKRGRVTVKDVLPLLPLAAVGIGMAMLTAYMEKWHVGTAIRHAPWDYGFATRCIIAGRVFWFYLAKLIVPFPLIFNYPRWEISASNPLNYLYPFAALAALIALAAGRKRLGNASVVAALFYAGTLFPAMGFFDVWPMQYSFVADHFAYLSLIGPIALVVAIARNFPSIELLTGIGAAALGVMVFLTASHASIFKSNSDLWKDTLNKTGQKSWLAANNYGATLLESADEARDPRALLDVAEKWFMKVIQLKPDHAEARMNLALVAEKRAELIDATIPGPATRQGLVSASAPTTNRADDYYRQAVGYYMEALKIDPKFTNAHFRLANRLRAMGDTAGAIEHLNEVLKLHPKYWQAEELLGSIAYQQGNLPEAIKRFTKMVDLQPDAPTPHVRLGSVLLESGDVPNGLLQWELALQADPANEPKLLNDFGVKMASSGKYSEATQYFQRALKIDPDSVETLTNLGLVAAKTGFRDQAAQLFERAMRLNPNYARARENLEAMRAGRLGPATTRATGSGAQ